MTGFTAFDGVTRIAQGDMAAMIAAQRSAAARGVNLLIYNDETGHVRDVDLREVPPPARGRPKLGVKAREVTLLPRHWEWLASQRGGASAALRRLVDEARKAETGTPKSRQNAAYAFLSSIGGDLPDFEEMSRALFAGDMAGVSKIMANWPHDIRDYAHDLLGLPREET